MKTAGGLEGVFVGRLATDLWAGIGCVGLPRKADGLRLCWLRSWSDTVLFFLLEMMRRVGVQYSSIASKESRAIYSYPTLLIYV